MITVTFVIAANVATASDPIQKFVTAAQRALEQARRLQREAVTEAARQLRRWVSRETERDPVPFVRFRPNRVGRACGEAWRVRV